jgi:phosphotransacetylase
MRKKDNYFQRQLGLDAKTSEAIKILMDEGLLEPLLVELRNALEAEEYQNTTKAIGNNFDPHLEKPKEKMTPIEAELVESSGLSLQTVREILEVT